MIAFHNETLKNIYLQIENLNVKQLMFWISPIEARLVHYAVLKNLSKSNHKD